MQPSDSSGTPRVWRTPIQVRFSDTDALGHINNAALILYLEHGRRAAFLDVFPGPSAPVVIVSLKADFTREVLPSDVVEVAVSVERVGTSSMTLNEVLHANDEVAVRAQTVIVHLDLGTRRPVPIPDATRAALLARD